MRLSDFKDEKAVEVVADLLEPIEKIAINPKMENAKGGSILGFARAMLKNNQRETMDMLAILSDVDPAEYHCTAATVVFDVLNMLNDPDLMQLFGLRRQTPASSGSASESTEAQKQSNASSDTAQADLNKSKTEKHTAST